MSNFGHSTKNPKRVLNQLAGVSSTFSRVGIGVRDADHELEVAGIVHISAEQSTSPSTPASADGGLIYVKNDGDLYYISQDQTEISLTAAASGMTSFQLEDGDSTEVTINNAKEVKFVEGGGIDINWTDTSTGSDGDPYDLTFTVSDTTVSGDSGSTGITPGDTLTIAGGTNISTAMSGDTLTINQSGGGEANEDSFKNIAVSGQDSVVADSAADTLTLVQAGGATITTNAGTDTITISSADTNTTYSAGNGIALSTTTFSVAAGTGLSQESSGLALSHLGIQSLSDPDADRIMFWDDSEGAMKFLVPNDNLAISGTNLNATDTNTTYSAGNGIALGGTTFTVAAGAGLAQESGGLALSHLGIQSLSDPDADRIIFWDDSAGATAWLTVAGSLSISGTTVTGTDTNTTYSAGNGIALGGTTFTVAAGTGLAQESGGLALSHLGIEGLSDPDADRIVFWDDSAGVAAWLTVGGSLSISGTTLTGTDTNTTYSAGNGIALSTTTFSVAAGNGLAQESSGLALDDPANLTELDESSDATDDKILLWDESASSWKHMTLDNLQDAIDTTGGGGGSGDVVAGSTFTTAGVIMACDGDDKTIDEPNATLTTGGQGMTVSSAAATPFEANSSTRDGNSTFKFITGSGDSGSAQNNQSSVQVIAQTSANANLYLGDTVSATRGGLTYKNNGDSMQLKAAGAVVLELDSGKVVEFKIAGGSKTVTLSNDAMKDDMSGPATVTVNATEWLQIKVNGNTRYIPVWS